MFHPIHSRYQTLKRPRDLEDETVSTSRAEPISLADMYRRIDENLAEL